MSHVTTHSTVPPQATQLLLMLQTQLKKTLTDRAMLIRRIKALKQQHDDEHQESALRAVMDQIEELTDEAEEDTEKADFQAALMANLSAQTALMQQWINNGDVPAGRGQPIRDSDGAVRLLANRLMAQQQKLAAGVQSIGKPFVPPVNMSFLPGHQPQPQQQAQQAGGTMQQLQYMHQQQLGQHQPAFQYGAYHNSTTDAQWEALIRNLQPFDELKDDDLVELEKDAPPDDNTAEDVRALKQAGALDDIVGVPKSNFRAWVRICIKVVVFAMMMKKRARDKQKARTEISFEMERYINQMSVAVKSWLRRICKPALITLVSDVSLDFSITNQERGFGISAWFRSNGLTDKEVDDRTMKLKVRTKACIESIYDQSTVDRGMPPALLQFIQRFVSNGNFLPRSFLLDHEDIEIETGALGATENMNETKARMLITNFVFTRVLVKLVVHPDVGMARVPKHKLDENSAILASVIYRIVRRSIFKGRDLPRPDSQVVGDIKSDADMEIYFTRLDDFIAEYAEKMTTWATGMLVLADVKFTPAKDQQPGAAPAAVGQPTMLLPAQVGATMRSARPPANTYLTTVRSTNRLGGPAG
eukprot:TRINITY_DN100_c0_g1_i1.p1 TRINITY_DN100_c0_g1~~TRINITY_DN100_c0_g1_i1.p1  ORF type:complete len:588 (+),score=135.02 TRINITY_DN100_c0_g1_i1:332-2095(+)